MPKKALGLEQHDWDFSDCPSAELPICFRYEYCRESKIADVIRLLRQHQEEFNSLYQKATDIFSKPLTEIKTDGIEFKLVTELVGMSAFLNLDLFACLPDFPDKPWLDLLVVERSEYMKVVTDSVTIGRSISGLTIKSGQNVRDLSTWHQYRQALHPEAIRGGFEISTSIPPARYAVDRVLQAS